MYHSSFSRAWCSCLFIIPVISRLSLFFSSSALLLTYFLVDTYANFFFSSNALAHSDHERHTRKYSPPSTMEYTILHWLCSYSVDWCLCADIGNHCRLDFPVVCMWLFFYYLYLVTILSVLLAFWVPTFYLPAIRCVDRFVSFVLGNAYRTVHRYSCLLRTFYLSRMNE